MKSIKPGRGPSAMGAMGAVVAVIFGIFWTIMAASAGAPVFFPIFGILFILIGIVQAVYNFKNATGENRFSEYDITEDGEEPDPLERRSHSAAGAEPPSHGGGASRFCPYCGAKAGEGFVFCPQCGRQLPNIP